MGAIARGYLGRGTDLDDLIQAGLIGAHGAGLTYEPSKGAFAKYAKWFIHGAIKAAIADGSLIRIGLRKRKSLGDDAPKLTTTANPDDLPAPERDDPRDPDPARAIDELKGRLARLSPAQAEVIRRRYGLGGDPPMGTREAARALRCCPSNIIQVERRAMKALKDAF